MVFLQLPKDDASKKKKNAPAKQFEGKAYKGSVWDSDKLSEFLAEVSTGRSRLTKLKKHPSVYDRISASAGKKDSTGKGQDSTKKRSPTREKTESTKRATTQSDAGQSKPTSGRGGRHTVDIGKDGNIRKSWEMQQEDKSAELQRERDRRRQVCCRSFS